MRLVDKFIRWCEKVDKEPDYGEFYRFVAKALDDETATTLMLYIFTLKQGGVRKFHLKEMMENMKTLEGEAQSENYN